MYFYILLYNLFYTVFASNTVGITQRKIQLVDAVIQGLEDEVFQEDERPCFEATTAMLHAVKNKTLWATWIWDSMQLPSTVLYGTRHHLGGYDQCLNPPWLTSRPELTAQYCTVNIVVTEAIDEKHLKDYDPFMDVEAYLKKPTKLGRHFNSYFWGACVSNLCNKSAVSKIARVMHTNTHLPSVDAKFEVISCENENANGKEETNLGYYLFILLIVTLVVVTLSSTIYVKYAKSDSLCTTLARCFCFKRNLAHLNREAIDELYTTHGIKFIASYFSVNIHYFGYENEILGCNALGLDKFMETSYITYYFSMEIFFEFYFITSGMLLVGTILSSEEKGTYDPIKCLIKRYFRLASIQAIMVFYLAYACKHVGSGPMWDKFTGQEEEFCRNSWWISLLMINNYISSDKICLMVSWYNACDYQMAVLGTILYILYRKNTTLGTLSFVFVLVFSTISLGITTYIYRLPGLIFYDVEKIINLQYNDVFLKKHIKVHNRLVSYLIGMIMGFFVYKYKPSQYRNSINQKQSAILITLTSMVTGSILVYTRCLISKDYNVVENVVYACVNRLISTLGLCLFVATCEYGYVPVIGDLLQLRWMIPLSRLSYGVYMVHLGIIFKIIYGFKLPLAFNTVNWITMTLGITVVSYAISFFLYMTFEAPLLNIVSHFLQNGLSTRKERNGVDEKKIK